jgi:hypothetical protein
MIETLKVWTRVIQSLRFFLKQDTGTPWHANVFVECRLMNVPECLMRDALIRLARSGSVRLTTWSYALGREAHFWEFPSLDEFFHNRDDNNHVRVKPVVAF